MTNGGLTIGAAPWFAIGLAVAVGLLLAGVSLLLLTKGEGSTKGELSKEIGSSLLTGTAVALAVFILQIVLDARRDEEQFRLTLGVTQHLEGLDPTSSLEGLQLSGKSLEKAQLADENLHETNFQEASLKDAVMTDADLSEAILFGAQLQGAQLQGSDLRGADLRFANLARTQLEGPDGPDLELEGAKTNALTCWPEDFVTSKRWRDERQALAKEETQRNGRTLDLVDRRSYGLGHACEFTFPNLIDNLAQYRGHGLQLETIARQYGRHPRWVLGTLGEQARQRVVGPAPLGLRRGCAGSHRLSVSQPRWRGGSSLIIVRERGEPLGQSVVYLLAGENRLLPTWKDRTSIRVSAPLRRGSRVLLFAAGKHGLPPEYAKATRVEVC